MLNYYNKPPYSLATMEALLSYTYTDIYQLPQNYTSRMLEQYNQAPRKVKNRKKLLLLLLITKVYTYTREDPLPLL